MEPTDRTLLRLHVEAVWGVRLPSFALNDIELLRDGSQPSWNLCAADLAEGRIYIGICAGRHHCVDPGGPARKSRSHLQYRCFQHRLFPLS